MHLKQKVGAIAVAALALFALVPVNAAQAAVTAATPQNLTIQRGVTAGSFVIHNGETLTVHAFASMSTGYFTANPITASTAFAMTAPTLTLNGATAVSSANISWSRSGGGGAPSSSSTSSFTVTETGTTSMSVNWSQRVTNTSGVDKTVALDDSTFVVTRGGTPVNLSDGGNTSHNTSVSQDFAGFSPSLINSFTVATGDSNVNFELPLCLSSTAGITAGVTVLHPSVTATRNGSPITFGGAGTDDVQAFFPPTVTVSQADTTTHQYHLMTSLKTPPTAGNYVVTAKLLDASNVEVGGACASGGGGVGMPSASFPTSMTREGSTTPTLSTISNHTFSSTKIDNSNTYANAVSSARDGLGGFYYWGPNPAHTKYVLSHLNASGTSVDTTFGGSAGGKGYIQLPSTLTSGPMPGTFNQYIMGVGYYGSATSNKPWYSVVQTMGVATPTYSLLLGTASATTVTAKTWALAGLKTLCGNTPNGVSVVPISSVNAAPLVALECRKADGSGNTTGSWVVVAKVNTSTGALTQIGTALGSSTRCASINHNSAGPQPYINTTSNPAASGTKASVIVYVPIMSSCASDGSATVVSARALSVGASGNKVFDKTYASGAELGSLVSVPRSLNFAPDLAGSSWIATAAVDSTHYKLLTFSTAGATSAKTTIALDVNATFVGSSTNLRPIKELSNHKVIFSRYSYDSGTATMVNGFATVANATTSTTATTATTGSAAVVVGNGGPRNIAGVSWNAAGTTASIFTFMSTTQFKTASWSLPKN